MIYELCYEFDDWLGDALLESPYAWITTAHLKAAIQSAGLTGVHFDNVKTYKSEQFDELYPDVKLPEFAWMKVEGEAGQYDFGIAQSRRLVVSERALKLLQSFGIPHAKVSDFEE